MIEIPISSNRTALIDDEDLDLVKYKWRYVKSGAGYAARTIKLMGRSRSLYLHRVILERIIGRSLKSNELVDHVDRNGLNNTRGNLRLADYSKNTANSKKPDNKSRTSYKGVTKNPSVSKGINRRRVIAKPWKAIITVKGRDLHLGVYDTPEEAAIAYDIAAKKHFGEFARLNFPGGK